MEICCVRAGAIERGYGITRRRSLARSRNKRTGRTPIPYPAVQILANSEDNYGGNIWGWVQAGELMMHDEWGGETLSGSEFVVFGHNYNGWYGGFQNLSTSSGPEEWWFNQYDYLYSWNESGPLGRLVSGGYVYATECSGMSTTCASF